MCILYRIRKVFNNLNYNLSLKVLQLNLTKEYIPIKRENIEKIVRKKLQILLYF